ncbi:hypothetical protein ACVW1C_008472 [Bradyrhizobium sp. USDA 4011]|uniref:cytochrome c biogenesis protein CcdA n=1 Tax=Bradyrhizobium japonicum TaxID=375 RepID=UPI0004895031|nr:hypothetical protein [Bradyrhizobium japonicum]RTM15501.1 MAG: hypothetical protein EKK33_00645 [Bradyrhizobiaceae bacterium]
MDEAYPNILRDEPLQTWRGRFAEARGGMSALRRRVREARQWHLLLRDKLLLSVISTVLVILSLAMFGFFEIQLPAAFVARMSGAASGGGALGARPIVTVVPSCLDVARCDAGTGHQRRSAIRSCLMVCERAPEAQPPPIASISARNS